MAECLYILACPKSLIPWPTLEDGTDYMTLEDSTDYMTLEDGTDYMTLEDRTDYMTLEDGTDYMTLEDGTDDSPAPSADVEPFKAYWLFQSKQRYLPHAT